MTEGTPIPAALHTELPLRLAPAETPVKLEHDASFYHAALIKRLGRPMSVQDFRVYGSELWTAASDTFGDMSVNLAANRFNIGGTLERNIEIDPGEIIPIGELSPEDFEDLFERSDSLTLDLRPTTETPETAYGFTTMTWERRQGSKLFFYGQGGSSTDKGVGPIFYARLFPEGSLPWNVRKVTGIRKTSDEDMRYKESLDADYASALAHIAGLKRGK